MTAIRQNELQKNQLHQKCHPAKVKTCFLLISIIQCSGFHTTGAMSCSSSRHTVWSVHRCPRNQFEWDSRAEKFNCSSFNQSCVDKSMFSYHCALNAEVNELLELCAPFKFIHGRKCVEYNFIGSIIQESIINCSNASVPCPEVYKSTEAFKYQSCYDAVQLRGDELNTTLNCSTFRCHNSTSDLPEDSFKLFLSIILPFILICLFTISIHFFIIIQVNRRLRKLQILRYKSPHQNTDFEESSLMLPKISRQLKKIEACKCRSDSLKRDRRYAQRSTSLPGLDFDIYHDYRINDKNQLHNKTYTW